MAVSQRLEDALNEIENAFELASSDLQQMVFDFHAEMRWGLHGEKSSLKMLPAHIDIAGGTEEGRFLALDLGGTNFRVLQVFLDGKRKAVVERVEKFVIPQDLMHGRGAELFDFIARSIRSIPGDYGGKREKSVPLGFTFSFPVDQTAINKGKLVTWTKGFTATDVVNKDVAQMLIEALRRNKMENIKVSALINDTVGTLLAGSYAEQGCDVGVIFGTGTNGCFRASAADIAKILPLEKNPSHMIVNTEWGNFDRIPVNSIDRRLDEASNNPGEQRMEKMISGLYLGELVRLVINGLVKQKIMFKNHSAKFSKGSLTALEISSLQKDLSPELSGVESFLKERGVDDSTRDERLCIRQICKLVSSRAARISAAAISSLVTWMDPEIDRHHTVAIDGTLYAKYPQFKSIVKKTLQEMHGEKEDMIRLEPAVDSSGVGAAVAAAVAAQGVD